MRIHAERSAAFSDSRADLGQFLTAPLFRLPTIRKVIQRCQHQFLIWGNNFRNLGKLCAFAFLSEYPGLDFENPQCGTSQYPTRKAPKPMKLLKIHHAAMRCRQWRSSAHVKVYLAQNFEQWVGLQIHLSRHRSPDVSELLGEETRKF